MTSITRAKRKINALKEVIEKTSKNKSKIPGLKMEKKTEKRNMSKDQHACNSILRRQQHTE